MCPFLVEVGHSEKFSKAQGRSMSWQSRDREGDYGGDQRSCWEVDGYSRDVMSGDGWSVISAARMSPSVARDAELIWASQVFPAEKRSVGSNSRCWPSVTHLLLLDGRRRCDQLLRQARFTPGTTSSVFDLRPPSAVVVDGTAGDL